MLFRSRRAVSASQKAVLQLRISDCGTDGVRIRIFMSNHIDWCRLCCHSLVSSHISFLILSFFVFFYNCLSNALFLFYLICIQKYIFTCPFCVFLQYLHYLFIFSTHLAVILQEDRNKQRHTDKFFHNKPRHPYCRGTPHVTASIKGCPGPGTAFPILRQSASSPRSGTASWHPAAK